MMVFRTSLATPGNLTTNVTPLTETDTFFLKAGVRNVALQSIQVGGKGAGLTAISGLSFRLCRFGTASTGGTAMTPKPCDPGMQAAKATSASRPTAGATRLNSLVITCGATGPGGWVAENPDSMEMLEGGGNPSIDLMDSSGTASMPFEFSFAHQE